MTTDLRIFEEYSNERSFVLNIVSQNGLALNDASPTLKNDFEIVEAAIRNNGAAYKYIGDELKANLESDPTKHKSLLLLALKTSYFVYCFLDKEKQADPDLALAAVTYNGTQLRYVKGSLNNQFNIVEAAVKQNGLALQYASTDLQGNGDIVKLAVWQNPNALKFASSELQNSAQMRVIQALSYISQVLSYSMTYIASCSDYLAAFAVGIVASVTLVALNTPALPAVLAGLATAASMHGLFCTANETSRDTPSHQAQEDSQPILK